MRNRITITLEAEGDVPLICGKVGHALNVLRDGKLTDYIHAAYTSVLGPDGISFEPATGGDADYGDDATIHVNIKEVDDE